MMMTVQTIFTALLLATSQAATTSAQQPSPAAPPTTASAEVMQCAQAQLVVDRLLESANSRIEMARQTNNPAEMRASIDALQSTLRDLRAQLAPCGKLEATGGHAGHARPNEAPAASPDRPTAAPKPAADPHAGHSMAPAKPPRAQDKPPAKAAPAPKPPAGADPHAGHGASPAQQADGKAVDPVCGLRVDPASAPSTKHAGQTHYFCSTKHRDLFVSNPAKFLPNK